MKLFDQPNSLKEHLEKHISKHAKLGFVPTMGALHEGHISLVERSIAENEHTIISIFVNPTQFNKAEDLNNYPKTLDADLEKIKTLDSQSLLVFTPQAADIYTKTFSKKSYDFGGIEHEMEGKYRSGHFDGVATIIEYFFHLIQPNNAYFGEKDYQQYLIVKKLAEQQFPAIKIVPCDIFREKNGLAMSSRNLRLSDEARQNAGIIYGTLLEVKNRLYKQPINRIEEYVEKTINNQKKFELEYFCIADETSLKLVKKLAPKKNYRAFIAVFVEGIRLIDNIALKEN
ncbi:MAG: pantoate--beta-alanine ligase [Flavobacteriaceae bacterium]|nr:pantoate--beta-alanine ligase [Flavobacteriaceae bacterium]